MVLEWVCISRFPNDKQCPIVINGTDPDGIEEGKAILKAMEEQPK